MKNWLHNKFSIRMMGLFGWGAIFAPWVYADAIDTAHACLDMSDLQCAIDIRDAELTTHPNDTKVKQLHARTLFYEGRYQEMVEILDALDSAGYGLLENGGFPAHATQAAFLGMTETQGKGVKVRYDPGLDRILMLGAVETLELSSVVYDQIFGGIPNHDLVVDIYPTAQRFIDASGIPPEAVRTTGVIALSKWNRLLLTSPRATAGGYAWRDTAAHEYVHLVVSWRSKDKAPVWLQEGLAKYLEHSWRGEREDYLSVYQQSLLAKALKDNSFVPFEKFALSMAYLDSGEEASLAYAQVATMVAFVQSKAGDAAFPIMMDRLATGEKAEIVVADLAGYKNFADFTAAWKQYVANIPLVKSNLASMPIALDGEGGLYSDDPVLNNREDLAKHVRLGDLLVEKKLYDAAIVEYKKVEKSEDIVSPNVLARLALCYSYLNKMSLAMTTIERGIGMYPEHAFVLQTAAQLYAKQGQKKKALEMWEQAEEIEPYDIATQQALVDLYQEFSQPENVKRHQEYLKILQIGGAYYR